MTTAKNAVVIGTVYFLVFIVTMYVPVLFTVAQWMFAGAPFIMIWMAADVLKNDHQNYPEPGKQE